MIAPTTPEAEAVEGQESSAPAVLVEPIAVNAEGAGRLLGVSGRTFQRMHAAGETPAPVLVGSRRRWIVSELRGWAAARCPGRERWEARREDA